METEKQLALKWYSKGAYDAETTEKQGVSIQQTMKDFETQFEFVHAQSTEEKQNG